MIPFSETEEFVLTGSSAGGLATFSWADYVKDLIAAENPTTSYFAFSDSGFFLDYENKKTGDHDFSIRMTTLF